MEMAESSLTGSWVGHLRYEMTLEMTRKISGASN